ncbi:MAG: peptidoglycan DD-metalloendopeptidase family protein [Oscillospiraceae bacterium]|nr:peptidoglycan DD-metalloendopeptidase family protein [Oscillospiraceae bacterium]
MKSKAFVRVVAVALAIILACSVLFSAISVLTARAVTQDEIDELKSQQSSLEAQKTEIESKINSLEYEQMTRLAKKQVLDEQMILTQNEIENITAQIAEYGKLIAEKKVEVSEAQKKEDAQWEMYKQRIRAMEENGIITYLAVIFEATSFADLLGRLDFANRIMKNDEKIYQDLDAARLATIQAKEELEEANEQQAAEKLALEEKQEELETQIAEAGEMISQIQSDISANKSDYDEIDSAEAALEQKIQDKIAQYEQEQEEARKAAEAAAAALAAQEAAEAAAAAAQEQENNSYDDGEDNSGGSDDYSSDDSSGGSSSGYVESTGYFIWPTYDSNYVTSYFGGRIHPIYGYYKNHNGIDIGASYGTDILAADSGTVIEASYDSGYGYYVMISHGNGTATLYAHMSSILVSEGETVYQGETIGLVGMTGSATGPHIHFEVWIDGYRTDPLNYFSNYTVSPTA